jgi:hypothetical protein
MADLIETIKRWFRRSEGVIETEVEGGEPVATPPGGSSEGSERETSTNAQTAAAADQPWPGND